VTRATRKLRSLKAIFRPALPPRASNDFATHVPVLVGLADAFPIRSVLELGCGRFSTLTFLNRSPFPQLERLDSLETDPAWVNTVEKLVGKDSRFSLSLVENTAQSISQRPIDDYDLVLIDDATEAYHRVATIEAVTRTARTPLVAIHDFEFEPYRDASRRFRHRFEFLAFHPTTAVLWNRADVNKQTLRRVAEVLRLNAACIAPDDGAAWKAAFTSRSRATS
jgi:predicted O-methyltransferase YrrM